MLNFRKLKRDYSPSVLKDGKKLFDEEMVVSARIVQISPQTVQLQCRVMGAFDNAYECQIEIDRSESMVIDSDCHCPYEYDCQHLAAVLFYLEENLDAIIVNFSKQTNLETTKEISDEEKKVLEEDFEKAKTKEVAKKDQKLQKELLEEYVHASNTLGCCPFFLPEEKVEPDVAEVAFVLRDDELTAPSGERGVEIQLALRLPYRSKPLHILDLPGFFASVRFSQPVSLGGRRYRFAVSSFSPLESHILKLVMDFASFQEEEEGKGVRSLFLDRERFGAILAEACRLAKESSKMEMIAGGFVPCFYFKSLEDPLRLSPCTAHLQIALEYLEVPAPKILLNPMILIDQEKVPLEEVCLFSCAVPGMIREKTYYRFSEQVRRDHLMQLPALRELTIPEPLFGTFVENSLSEMMRFADVTHRESIEKFVTLPFVDKLVAVCDLSYLDGELEASLSFLYGDIKVPASAAQLAVEDTAQFITEDGILARNLTEERKIVDDLFQDFLYNPSQGVFICKVEKKIVEFMTETIPNHQDEVTFNCPENLLDQFIYDDSTFTLKLKESDKIDQYEVDLVVDGYLNGVTLELLWECLASRRTFIDLLPRKAGKGRRKKGVTNQHKILVLDLEKLEPVIRIFDEIGISTLDDHKELRPLWSLTTIEPSLFKELPITFSMTRKLRQIQQQMLGNKEFESSPLPSEVSASFRGYQAEGVNWLERLRHMHLNGILADDMGLGKTLQAITAITQLHKEGNKGTTIVICPTSLVYNWKEELSKFTPHFKVLVIDGTPNQRKKLIKEVDKYDVVVTSYSLLQKDVEEHQKVTYGYVILDEAQHIKNRGTRNAKSVKTLNACHRLILTGTPIENSLEELWSLFDFLMPGLLSSYERFVEKYIRNAQDKKKGSMQALRRKLSPFILRRMKKDVLKELPPVSEIIYHCHLSDAQRELYTSYAKAAREELSSLVNRDGFDRVQIHVLATLTRLKQICCHPAIFAKERAEVGDSAKYDMLMELIQNLMRGEHKAVIFSQYTRMLNIMRQDLDRLGIPFEYLDGSSKDRLGIVKRFNEDKKIPLFLVSLKAGGSGLNLVGADTVVHYDMWWNPAVESQATDRVHRIGQKQSVSSYKLVTLNTIEEKILELQNRKKGLVKQVVNCDEEAMSKLTWEEVLELLQT